MPKATFADIMERRVVDNLVECKWAAQKGKTNFTFSLDRVPGTNLCFGGDDETQFELVLKFINAHCEGCKITVYERPEEYNLTVDWS